MCTTTSRSKTQPTHEMLSKTDIKVSPTIVLLQHFQLSLLVLRNCSQNLLELKTLFMTEAYVLYDTFAFVNIIQKACGCLLFLHEQHPPAHLIHHLCFYFPYLHYFSFLHLVAVVVTKFAFPSYSPAPSSSYCLSKQNKTKQTSVHYFFFPSSCFFNAAGGQLMLILLVKHYFSQFLCLFFQMC